MSNEFENEDNPNFEQSMREYIETRKAILESKRQHEEEQKQIAERQRLEEEKRARLFNEEQNRIPELSRNKAVLVITNALEAFRKITPEISNSAFSSVTHEKEKVYWSKEPWNDKALLNSILSERDLLHIEIRNIQYEWDIPSFIRSRLEELQKKLESYEQQHSIPNANNDIISLKWGKKRGPANIVEVGISNKFEEIRLYEKYELRESGKNPYSRYPYLLNNNTYSSCPDKIILSDYYSYNVRIDPPAFSRPGGNLTSKCHFGTGSFNAEEILAHPELITPLIVDAFQPKHPFKDPRYPDYHPGYPAIQKVLRIAKYGVDYILDPGHSGSEYGFRDWNRGGGPSGTGMTD